LDYQRVLDSIAQRVLVAVVKAQRTMQVPFYPVL